MPFPFTKKKSSNSPVSPAEPPNTNTPPPYHQHYHDSRSSSPEKSDAATKDKDKKKSRASYFAKEREKDNKQLRPKTQQRFSWSTTSRRSSTSDEHPLNLPPDELRRLSQLSHSRNMDSRTESYEGGVSVPEDPMEETTPAPETPGSFPQTNGTATPTNGVNGDHSEQQQQEDQRPTPPPHRTPKSPSPPPEIREAEAEAFKAAGNKLYKAGQYGSAIDEYTKGGCCQIIPYATARPN